MTSATQQHLLLYPEKLKKFTNVRIWSDEHKQWWRPDGIVLFSANVTGPAHPLQDIAERYISQDNRATDVPLFVVEQKIRDYGYSSEYSDYYEWVDEDDLEGGPLEGDQVDWCEVYLSA